MKSIDDVRNLVIATRGLAGLSDLPSLVTKACRRMFDLIAADVAAIALYDREDALIVGAAQGTTASWRATPLGSALGGANTWDGVALSAAWPPPLATAPTTSPSTNSSKC